MVYVMDAIPEQRHISLQIRHAAKALNNMPREFSTCKEARYYWDLMMRQYLLFYHDNGEVSLPPTAMTLSRPGTTVSPEPGEPVESREQIPFKTWKYLEIMDQWDNAYDPLFNSLKHTPAHSDYRGALALKIYSLASRLAHPATSDPQITIDSAELVQLADKILKHPKIPTHMLIQQQPSFAFDGSVILAIFRTIIHCRIRKIRRDAIALLKIFPRREGFWDSEMAARVAEWFVEAEEEGLEAHEEVSPNSRLMLISCNEFVLAERKTLVRCARQVKGQPTELLQPVWLTW